MSRLDESRTATTRDDYQTPEHILKLVREVFGGLIYLDPATVRSNPTKAFAIYTPDEDGLNQLWNHPNWFVNPPYGPHLKPWSAKIADEGQCVLRGNGQAFHGITLVPGRTDTKWYDALATTASAEAHIRGRLKFRGCKQGAQFPSVLFYYGQAAEKFADVFSPIARVYVGANS